MKYLFSFLLILIYMLGAFQSSWVLVDFYWNRDDYTQKYCLLLDEGITQCQASCYLENLLEDSKNDRDNTIINSNPKVKIIELSNGNELSLEPFTLLAKNKNPFLHKPYHFDFYSLIFHPPKG